MSGILKELAKRADTASIFKDNRNASLKSWINTAANIIKEVAIHNKGDRAYKEGRIEDAYVQHLKAVTIVLEFIPTLKDYSPTSSYDQLREEVVVRLNVLEDIKAKITAQELAGNNSHQKLESLSSTRMIKPLQYIPNPPKIATGLTITSISLVELLKESDKHILIIDLRTIEDYVNGHILFPHIPGKLGGVCQIEPSWITSNCLGKNIEEMLNYFETSLSQQKAFQKRSLMHRIIIYDSNSTSMDGPIGELHNCLRKENLDAMLLVGGYNAYQKLTEQLYGNAWRDYIQVGAGSGTPPPSTPGSPIGSNRSSLPTRHPPPKRHVSLKVYSPVGSPFDDPFHSFKPLAYAKIENEKGTYNLQQSLIPIPDSDLKRSEGSKRDSLDISSFDLKFPDISYDNVQYPSIEDVQDPRLQDRGRDDLATFNSAYPDLSKFNQSQAPPVPKKPQLQSTATLIIPPVPSQYSRPPATHHYIPPTAPPQYGQSQASQNYIQTPLSQKQNAKSYASGERKALAPALMPNRNSASQVKLFPPNLAKTNSQIIPSPPLGLPKQRNVPAVQTQYPSSNLTNFAGRGSSQPDFKHYLPNPVSNFSSQSSYYSQSYNQSNLNHLPPPPQYSPKQFPNQNTQAQYQRYPMGAPKIPEKIELGAPTFQPRIKTSIGMSGLRNLGNTCFMNSTLQCLSATVPLARYFLDGSYRRHVTRSNPLSSGGKIADSYAGLIKSMWNDTEDVVIPTNFKGAVGAIHPRFGGNEQQDSQEFLAFILDQLHEDLNLARRNVIPQAKEIERDLEGVPDQIVLKAEWDKYHLRNWSIIVDMFQGSLKSVLTCQTCGKVL